LAHALLPAQATAGASGALDRSLRARDDVVLPEHAFVEFGSLLRKSVTRRTLAPAEATQTLLSLFQIGRLVSANGFTLRAAFDLATRLNQPDTFDTTGYALAQSLNAEFWVSDRRFFNAAQAAGLTGVSLFD
jgi:predicted nucleic acid-binding protein